MTKSITKANRNRAATRAHVKGAPPRLARLRVRSGIAAGLTDGQPNCPIVKSVGFDGDRNTDQ
jgi:hypothetical protein